MWPFKDKRPTKPAQVVRVWMTHGDFRDIVGETEASMKTYGTKGYRVFDSIRWETGKHVITGFDHLTLNLAHIVSMKDQTHFKEYA